MTKLLETNEQYHKNLAVGSTLLKKIHNKSILHAFAEERKETAALVMGAAVHCAILEPERFSQDFAVLPDCDRRTKEGKAIYEQFITRHAGKMVLTIDQVHELNSIKNAVMSHEIAKLMLTGGEAEYSYYSTCPITNLAKKCRPDYKKNGALIDLKTTMDASFEGFARQMGNLGYLIQAAHYVDVYNESQGTNVDEFFFVAVENKAPYAVAVYRVDSMQLEIGREGCKKSLAKLADFYACGGDPKQPSTLKNFGYPAQIIDIQVPFYLLNKITNDEVA